MAERIGVTMRTAASETGEWRDCLARDWSEFLGACLPETSWAPVPNLGRGAVEFAKAWELDGLILTGGNSIGECRVRDETETALLAFALDAELPVLGICRGLQLIQTFFGGGLVSADPKRHVCVRHRVDVIDACAPPALARPIAEVNSYHDLAVAGDALADPLEAFAVTRDGLAEGIRHPHAPILAIQWHPERERPTMEYDAALVRFALQSKGARRCE